MTNTGVKLKVCVCIDWYLPGTKAGGPVRSVFSIINLLKDKFDFYLITTNTDLGEKQPYKNVAADKLFVVEGVHYYYFSSDKLNQGSLLRLIGEIQPDLVYLNSFWSYNFSISIVRLKNKKQITSPVLLAPRGMLGKGAMGIKSFKKKLFLFITKQFGWYKNITFHATQEQEMRDIRSVFPEANVLIAPNINAGTLRNNTSKKEEGKLKLFYLSRIAKVKNLDFALELLKTIPQKYTIEYDIYGNLEDKEYWEQCLAIVKNLPPNITVNYKKELQFNEVQNTISEYNCLFLPTLNENFGHSIVESLLCGCPVIISDQTPWNDLEMNGAGFALPLNKPEQFTNAIVHYAKMNQTEFSRASKDANKYISSKIDLNTILDQYKKLFNGRT